MATKKSSKQKTTMIKIAEKIGQLAGEAVNKKEHLVDMATGAINSVRSTINNITAAKKSAPKKAVKAAVKKVAKKAKPAVKKITKAAAGKKAAVKKTIKKVVKKAAKKVPGKK